MEKKLSMVGYAFALLGVVGVGQAWGADGVWTRNVANTPATAYDWTDSANWRDGEIPGANEKATVTSLGSPATYIRLPDSGISLTNLQAGANAIFLGGPVTMNWLAESGHSALNGAGTARLYGGLVAGQNVCYASNVQIAGKARCEAYNLIFSSGTICFRHDLFAESAGEVRDGDYELGSYQLNPGSASCKFYTPVGADACTGTWKLTEGSPFATRVSDAAHPLAVGTLVSGTGLPEGTFLKRIYSDREIELSEPATASSDGVELAFAAFAPKMEQTISNFMKMGSTSDRLYVVKEHEQDVGRIVFNRFYGTDTRMLTRLGLDATDLVNHVPGTLVFREVNGWSRISLLECHLEFAGKVDTGVTTFGAAYPFSFDAALPTATARLTVPASVTASIAVFTNWTGTVAKDGPGRLSIALGDAVNTGVVDVREGVLELTAPDTVGADGVVFASLAIASGAELAIPAAGMTVDAATFADGAVVRGPGRILVKGIPSGKVVLLDGAKITYSGTGTVGGYIHQPTAQVVGHPAFWVDASKRDSLVCEVEDGVTYVTRWNDCRDGEPMFCTNIVRRPRLMTGEKMSDTYVKIGYVNTHWCTNTEGLVWSQPIDGIKAVFMAMDPTDGGGTVLGSTARLPYTTYAGTQGGQFYRTSTGNYGSAVINPSYSTPCVLNGRLFLDGQERTISKQGYLGAFPQILDFHVNTNYAANARHWDLACDAFGTGCYLDGHQYKDDCGRQRLSEVLIYTNALTHAERVQVAMYLSRKWLGKDIAYSDVDAPSQHDAFALAPGESMAIAAGVTEGFLTAEDGVDVVKDGEGRLVISSLAAGDVTVKAGELLVKSFSVKNTSLPGAPWVHVDAADAATVETNAAGAVTQWHNLNGDGQTYRPLSGAPTYGTKTQNGLPLVDTGSFNVSGASSMILHKADGTRYVHADGEGFIHGAPTYKSVFAAASSQGGGGCLLGSWGNGYPWHGTGHSAVGGPVIAATIGTYTGWKLDLTQAFSNNVYQARCNGMRFDPFVESFSGGFDQFTFSGNFGRKSDTLATYGQTYGYMGGLAYGEVLIFTNVLDNVAITNVETYLRTKWQNAAISGRRVAVCESLTVAAGARIAVVDWAAGKGVDVYGEDDGTITTGALGGAGEVAGSVTLRANGAFRAEVLEDGTVGTLTVTGTADLSRGGEVEFVGAADKLKVGEYPIVSASALAFDGVWSCVSPSRSLKTSLIARDGVLSLRVNNAGTILIFR